MPCRAPLPPDLASVLRWLRRERPTVAREVDLLWCDDPLSAEAALRDLLPMPRPRAGGETDDFDS